MKNLTKRDWIYSAVNVVLIISMFVVGHYQPKSLVLKTVCVAAVLFAWFGRELIVNKLVKL